MARIKYAFRVTHINNIPRILLNGFVHATSPNADPDYVSIGDTSVIAIRSQKLTSQGFSIGDYIPFYFGNRSPMLYVIQNGFNGVQRFDPEELVYCVIRIEDIIASHIDCVFSDGHALNTITAFYDGSELPHLDEIVSYADVFASNWIDENDRDLKRRKEAELLIKDNIPPEFLCGFVVYNQNACEKLLRMGIEEGKVVIKKSYYF